MKALSIAIPTYNRSQCLKKELESILPQILHLKDEVEIVISDNASPDNTGAIVDEVSKSFDFPIKYIRLEKGIYFEDNFANAVNNSEGRYIQMAGDDDIMSPGFYDLLFKLIRENYGLIHFNRLEGDVNCCNGCLYDKYYDKPMVTGSLKEFVARVGTGPGFMTSLVFRRDCWEEGLKYKNKLYYGYNFLGQLYQGALHLNATCCYYYFPMIIQRGTAHSFNKEYPLFLFVALPSILNDVDVNIAKEWMNQKLFGVKNNEKITLASVYKDKAFFREHSHEMELFLIPKYKKIFRFMISSFTPKLICKIYIRLLAL